MGLTTYLSTHKYTVACKKCSTMVGGFFTDIQVAAKESETIEKRRGSLMPGSTSTEQVMVMAMWIIDDSRSL